MNATNRGMNRTVLLVVGVILLGIGGAAVAAVSWPLVGDVWKDWSSTALDWAQQADRASRISETTQVSWFVVAVLAVLLLVVVFAVTLFSRLGGGHSSAVIRDESGEGAQGPVTIRQGFASDLITHSLQAHDEILTSKVNARRLRGVDVLHVSVTPRQNVSPAHVAETVTVLVDRLGGLTGRQIPTLVTIHAGIRSRIAADQSRVN